MNVVGTACGCASSGCDRTHLDSPGLIAHARSFFLLVRCLSGAWGHQVWGSLGLGVDLLRPSFMETPPK